MVKKYATIPDWIPTSLDDFKTFIQNIWGSVTDSASDLVDWIADALKKKFDILNYSWQDVLDAIEGLKPEPPAKGKFKIKAYDSVEKVGIPSAEVIIGEEIKYTDATGVTGWFERDFGTQVFIKILKEGYYDYTNDWTFQETFDEQVITETLTPEVLPPQELKVIQFVVSPCAKIHGLKYSEGYYYATNRDSPAYILKIDEKDIYKITKQKLTYTRGSDIEIIGDFIYIICSEGIEIRNKDTLAKTGSISKPAGAGKGQSLARCKGYLFAAFLNRKLTKIDIFSNTIISTAPFSFHTVEGDTNYIYGTDEKNTIRKVNPDTLKEIKYKTISMSWIHDEIAIHGDFVYYGSETYASKAIIKIKKDLSSYETKTLGNGTYFIVSDGKFLYAGPSTQISSLWRLNFDLSDSYTLSLPSPLKAANEMAFGAKSRALISTWTTPAYFALLDLGYAVSPVTFPAQTLSDNIVIENAFALSDAFASRTAEFKIVGWTKPPYTCFICGDKFTGEEADEEFITHMTKHLTAYDEGGE